MWSVCTGDVRIWAIWLRWWDTFFYKLIYIYIFLILHFNVCLYCNCNFFLSLTSLSLSATDCDCHSQGSVGHQCDPVTGQCPCRHGAIGRQCSDCQPGQWGFPNCQQCQCNGHAESCDPETGACYECRDYTAGQLCERWETVHWLHQLDQINVTNYIWVTDLSHNVMHAL